MEVSQNFFFFTPPYDPNLTTMLRDSALNYMIQYQLRGVDVSSILQGRLLTMSPIVQSYWLLL